MVISRVKELLRRQPGDPVQPVAAVESPTPAPAPEATLAPAPAGVETAGRSCHPQRRRTTAMPPRNSMSISTSSIRRLRDSRALQPAVPSAFDASLDLATARTRIGPPAADSAEMVRDIQALEPPMIGDLIEPSAQLATALAPEPVARPRLRLRARRLDRTGCGGDAGRDVAPVMSVEPLVAVPSVPRDLPPLADAFAAILAAEQGDPSASSRGPRLRQQPPAPSSPTKSSIACRVASSNI